MYEIKITAASIDELRGRITALAAEWYPSSLPPVTTVTIPTLPVAESAETQPDAPAAKKRTKPGKPEQPAEAPVAEEPVSEEPAVEEPTSEEPAEEPAPTITYEQIRSAILKVSLAVGRDGVTSIFKRFGATRNAQEIDPKHYPEVLAAAQDMLGG